MARPRKRLRFYKLKLRAWAMAENLNGVIKIVLFGHY